MGPITATGELIGAKLAGPTPRTGVGIRPPRRWTAADAVGSAPAMVTLGIAEAPASRRHCDHDRPNLWRVALAICSLARLPSHGRNSRAAEADRQDKWRTV